MPENKAELILALRDEISSGMAKINTAVALSRREIAGLSAAGQQGAAGLASLKEQAAAAGDTVKKALAFAGVAVGIYEVASAVKEFYASTLEAGGKVEVLKGAMHSLGQMYGISKVNLDDMVATLHQLNVPLDTATKAVNSFIKSGLNVGELPAFARAVKDIAVSQGKSFQETWEAAIQSVVLGSARGLRSIEVNLGDMATVAGKAIKDLEMEAGLTAAQKSKIMLDALMGYAKQFEGLSESAVGSYLRQQSKLKIAAEDAKVAFFDALKPLATAITGEKIKVWEDLYTWVNANRAALTNYGEAAGVFVGKMANTVKTVLELVAAHKDLVLTLLEFKGYQMAAGYLVAFGTGAYKAGAAYVALAAGKTADTVATTVNTAALAVNTTATTTAAGAKLLYVANASGAVTQTIALGTAAQSATPAIAGAGAAALTANAAFAAWLPTIAAVGLALIALGGVSIKRQVEKTPSLVGDMLVGEAYGAMSESGRAAMLDTGRKADAAAAARRRLTTPPTGEEAQQKSWEEFQRQHQNDEFKAAMQKVQDKQDANMPAGAGKGGAGSDAAGRSLESFISRMKQEIAKGSGEGMAALSAWRQKEIETLEQLAAKGVDVAEGKQALAAATYAKEAKLAEDFYHLEAKESGNAYLEIDRQAQEWLTKFSGIKDKQGQIIDVSARVQALTARKYTEQQTKDEQEALSRKKDYLDKLAGYAPLLSQQLALQREILGVEEEQAKKKLDLDLITHRITQAEWQQLDAVRAQSAAWAQLAQNKKDWATQGAVGGYKDFQVTRWQEMETREATWMKDFLGRAEQWTADSIGQGIIDGIEGNQGGVQQALKGLIASGVKQIVTFNVQKLWDALAGAPDKSVLSGAQSAAQALEQGGFSCGQKILTAAQEAAGILGAVNLSGRGSPGETGGFGGRTDIYGEYLRSRSGAGSAAGAKAGSTHGSVGGYGGGGVGGGAASEDGGLSGIVAGINASFATWKAGGEYWKNVVGAANYQAGQAGKAAASMGMMSNVQLGLGAAGLGLGAIGLATGSQGLVTAGMVLQTAAVAIQIAAMIMKATSFIPGAAEGGFLSGAFHPVARFADGHPFVSRPTLGWVGEGENPEAVIPLKGGMVPVRLTGKGSGSGSGAAAPAEAPPALVYNPTYNFSAIDARGLDQILAEHLPRHEAAIRGLLKKIHKKGGRVEDLF